METIDHPVGSVGDLRTFLDILERGSFSAAAEAGRVSVNAVSQRLSRLEARLGRRLVERTTRSVRPTDEGRRFAERCRRALAELDRGLAELEEDRGGLHGSVRVLAHPATVEAGALASLAELATTAPALELSVRVAPSLEGAAFDVALWVGGVTLRSLVQRRVGRLVWALAASPVYAEARGVPRHPAELAGYECLRALRSPRESRWVLSDERGRQVSAELSGRFEANDTEVLRQALYAGLGIGLRPRSEVVTAAREGRLVHVLPEWVFDPVPLAVLTAGGRAKLERVKAVADALARGARRLI